MLAMDDGPKQCSQCGWGQGGGKFKVEVELDKYIWRCPFCGAQGEVRRGSYLVEHLEHSLRESFCDYRWVICRTLRELNEVKGDIRLIEDALRKAYIEGLIPTINKIDCGEVVITVLETSIIGSLFSPLRFFKATRWIYMKFEQVEVIFPDPYYYTRNIASSPF